MAVVDAVSELINQHRLHEAYPVDLTPLSDHYKIRFVDLSPDALGFAYQGQRRGLIGVNRNLDYYQQRMTICHEASHLLNGGANSAYLCRLDGWLYSRYELLAQRAAAYMLLCRTHLLRLVYEGATVPELAEAFAVPEVLIELRLRPLIGGSIDEEAASRPRSSF